MQWEMECAERKWADYISYDPRVKVPGLVLFVKRVDIDEPFLKRVRREVMTANIEAEEIIADLKKMVA
jgi:hypothetical protein